MFIEVLITITKMWMEAKCPLLDEWIKKMWLEGGGGRCVILLRLEKEGDGTPLQYSCLENPMDGGAW